MTKLSEMISAIALQSGLAADDAALVTLLGNKSLESVEVPDEISTRLTVPRLTMDAAKQNPDLKRHFAAQALNGVDTEIARLVAEMQLPDDAKIEIESESNTFKKVSLLSKKIAVLEQSKVGAANKDKTVLDTQIGELNRQLSEVKTGWATEKATLLKEFDGERVSHELKSFVLGQNLNLPDTFTPEAKFAAVEALYRSELQARGIQIVRKDGAISLQTNEGTDYFDPTTNQKLGVNDFILKTLANKGALKASGQVPPATPRPPQFQQQQHQGAPAIENTAFGKALDGMIGEAN